MSRKNFFTFAVLFLFFNLFTASPSIVNSSNLEDFGANQTVVKFSENFDGVMMPQMPNGWTVSSTGTGASFATTTAEFDTSPNSAFTAAPSTTSSASLISPTILITGATSVLNFRQKFSMENTWDGGVLEISIAGGQFQDIINAGGTFITGGYNSTLNPSTNPIGNRPAWSGATQTGFLLTSVRLPSNAFGQSVQFRWRFGSNDSFGGLGWWIDTVTVESMPTGANTNSITISNVGTALPYPSEIQVAGLTGLVTGVSVSLENFSHTSPDDVDILLVAPNGRSVVLMSDAGGNNAVTDVDLTLTDAAANFLPDSSAISSGVFKPTNFDGTDTFPTPAPQMNYAANLASLYGTNPNGTWQLFVVDDTGENAGTLSGGWNLDIKTSVNACLFSLDPTAASFPNTGGAGDFDVNIPAGCGWTATLK